MKKLFLQNLFTKSLQKGFLPKLLLLVVLFFGGCSTVSNNATDIAKNRTGIYYTSENTTLTFTIDKDGSIYTQNNDSGNAEYSLGIASSGADYIEYIGTDDDKKYVRVVLSDITDSNGGTRTEYDSIDGESISKHGFTWYTSN